MNRIRMRLSQAAVCLCVGVLASGGAHATTITDPVGDFIPTFTGTKNGDLDVVSAFATFDGTNFRLGATLNGTIGTSNSLYVIGINRGAGTNNFAAIGAPGVVFDAVVTLTGTGVVSVRDFVAGTTTPLASSAATITGNAFAITVPLALLPSQGRAPSNYLVNVWPRDASAAAGNGQISDFAPDNGLFPVPEPGPLGISAAGLLAMGLFRRRA